MVTLHPTAQSKASKRCMEATATEPSTRTMAIRVVEFSNRGYKIRKVFA
jgi:hypothetical protein